MFGNNFDDITAMEDLFCQVTIKRKCTLQDNVELRRKNEANRV